MLLSGPGLTWPSSGFAILPYARGWEQKYKSGCFFYAVCVCSLNASPSQKETEFRAQALGHYVNRRHMSVEDIVPIGKKKYIDR